MTVSNQILYDWEKFHHPDVRAPFRNPPERSNWIAFHRDAFVGSLGIVFDCKSRKFISGGCQALNEDWTTPEYNSTKSKVVHHDKVVSLVAANSIAFYHIITETLPRFMLVYDFIQRFKDFKLFVTDQENSFISQLLQLFDIPKERLVFQYNEEYLHANLLVNPAQGICDFPNMPSLLRAREMVFQKIKQLDPSWKSQVYPFERSEEERQRIAGSGGVVQEKEGEYVLVINRKSKERKIKNFSKLCFDLARFFPSGNLYIYIYIIRGSSSSNRNSNNISNNAY